MGTAWRMGALAFEPGAAAEPARAGSHAAPATGGARSSRGPALPPGARRRLASPRAWVPRAAPHKRRALLFASRVPRAALSGATGSAILLGCSVWPD